MKDEVSIIIKTFERPHALERLLGSILASPAAGCRILVGDSSLHVARSGLLLRDNVACYGLPYDSGISYGRNYLVDRVTTPYCVVLDDDLVFTPDTRLDILLGIVRERGFDLAAGEGNLLVRGKPGHANIRIAGGKLTVTAGAPPESFLNGLPVYDMVSNFFLATTASLRDIRWDEQLPVYGNHLDFFIRYSAKYKVTYTDRVLIHHEEGGYSTRGARSKNSAWKTYRTGRRFSRKHGLDQHGKVRGFVEGYVSVVCPKLGSRLKSMLGWHHDSAPQ